MRTTDMLQTQSAITLTLLAFLVGGSWGNPCYKLPTMLAERNRLQLVQNTSVYMVFRIQPGIRRPSLEAYEASGNNSDSNGLYMDIVMPCGCKTTDSSLPCDHHFRSRLLDWWEMLPIDMVRVGIYKNNKEVKYFLFDGWKSNFINWFSQDRLMESSYSDLTPNTSTNFFSIKGDPEYSRHFFINHKYDNCPNDMGWLMVVDKADPPCTEWEKHGPFPTILYSPYDTRITYAEDAAVADLMVISVRFHLTSCPYEPSEPYQH